jgi:hypothetical protein
MAGGVGQFTCGGCGKTHSWKPELSGRRVKCACGHVMAAPISAPAQTREDHLYDFADDEFAAKPKARRAVAVETTTFKAGEDAGETATAAVSLAAERVRSIEYQHPTTQWTLTKDQLFPDRIKDLYLPVGLIGVGTAIELVTALVFEVRGIYDVPGRMGSVGITMLIHTAVLLVSILVAGKLRHINFGPLPVAVFKLYAVAQGTRGLTLAFGPLLAIGFGFVPLVGGLLIWLIPFVFLYTLLGTLFDLDQEDTRYCLCVVFLVTLAVYVPMRLL